MSRSSDTQSYEMTDENSPVESVSFLGDCDEKDTSNMTPAIQSFVFVENTPDVIPYPAADAFLGDADLPVKNCQLTSTVPETPPDNALSIESKPPQHEKSKLDSSGVSLSQPLTQFHLGDRYDVISSTQIEFSLPTAQKPHHLQHVSDSTGASTGIGDTVPLSDSVAESIPCVDVSRSRKTLSSGSSSSAHSLENYNKNAEDVYILLASWIELPEFKKFLGSLGDSSHAERKLKTFIDYFESKHQKNDSSLSGYLGDRSKSDSSGLCRTDTVSTRVSSGSLRKYRTPRKSRDSGNSRLSVDSNVALFAADESFFSQEGDSLEEGNTVYAPWTDNYYYPAIVRPLTPNSSTKARDMSKCRVEFEDGDRRIVNFTRVYNHATLPAGAAVHVTRDLNHEYERARITRVLIPKLAPKFDETYEVEFTLDRQVLRVKRNQVIIEKSNLLSYCVPPKLSPLCDAMETATLYDSTNKSSCAKRRLLTTDTSSNSTGSPSIPLSMKKSKSSHNLFRNISFIITGISGGSGDTISDAEPSFCGGSPLKGSQASASSQSESDHITSTPPDLGEVHNLITEQGGVVINQLPSNSGFFKGVYLLASRALTTMKYLTALSCDIPCLDVRWVLDCVSQSKVLSISSYRLPAGIDSTGQCIEWTKCVKFLKDKKVLVPSANTKWAPWCTIVKNLGGEVITRAHARSLSSEIYFAIAADRKDMTESVWLKLEELEVPVVTTDFLVQSLVSSECLDFSLFLYMS